MALLHHTGCGNLGDDAIIDCVVEKLRRQGPDVEIVVFSMNPKDTFRRHGITSYPMRRYTWQSGHNQGVAQQQQETKLQRWLKRIGNAMVRFSRAAVGEWRWLIRSYRTLRTFDLLIVTGGGQLTERGGPWSFPYALFIWGLMAKRLRVRCVYLNVGAGPLNHPLSKFFILRGLRNAEYVSFRDKQSQQLAGDLGFRHRSHIFPDNVYDLDVSSWSAARSQNNRIVGLAPMPFPFSDLLKHPANADVIQNELVDKMATFAALLTQQSYSIRLFGSDTKADPPVIQHVREVLFSRYRVETPEYIPVESIYDLLSRMMAMDYVVTCRFHGVVFAHLLNKPVLAIAHHPKVTHLMLALGLSKYCVDMRTFDPAGLMDSFLSLVSEADAIKKNLRSSLAAYRKQLAEQWESIFPTQAAMASAGVEIFPPPKPSVI